MDASGGTPQGAVISPLWPTSIFMPWTVKSNRRATRMVRYAE